MIERWFGEISEKRIRRGSFKSIWELLKAIKEYLAIWNQTPRKFVWTKSADMIIRKVNHCKEALVTPHRDSGSRQGCSANVLRCGILQQDEFRFELARAGLQPGKVDTDRPRRTSNRAFATHDTHVARKPPQKVMRPWTARCPKPAAPVRKADAAGFPTAP